MADMKDIDIRRTLLQEIAALHESEGDTLIVEEMGLCQGVVRVDIAVVNGSIHGFEIKSARDTLSRLNGQCGIYCQAFDFVTIVAASSHLSSIRTAVPRWWGIQVATKTRDGVALREVRTAKQNPEQNPLAVAQMLWRDEALTLLSKRGLDQGMRSKPRLEIWKRLAASLTLDDLKNCVREVLKARENWRASAQPR